MTKQTIEVEGLPDGYKAIAYRTPINGESYFYEGRVYSDKAQTSEYLIVEKIQPRRIVLDEIPIKHAVKGDYMRDKYGNCLIPVGCEGHDDTYTFWREVKETDLSLTNDEPKLEVGDVVRIYDSYRFASMQEIRGRIIQFGEVNNVCVELSITNNPQYPIGSAVWVHVKQVEPLVEAQINRDEPKLDVNTEDAKELLNYLPNNTKFYEKLLAFIGDK